MNVRYSARANRHIDAIHDYIAKRDPDTATRVIAHIRKTLAHLAAFPFMGRSGKVSSTRQIVISRLPFIAVYRIVDGTVVVLCIYHCAQDR